jgi:glycosyltransferase involved in cell wall biosynthesis
MKLLLVSQYFWPETFPINNLIRKLHALGCEVTVVTGKPNYPEGKIFPGYSATGIRYEEYGGVELIRIPMRPRKKGAFGLFINYVSFIVSGIWYMPSLLKGRKFDVILVYAISPITSAIPAIRIKHLLGAHLAVWVQDLWPQSLSATGYIKNKLVLKLVGFMVAWIYARTDTLLAQSHAFVRAMENYADRGKIVYYPNSIEPQPDSVFAVPDVDTSCFSTGFSVVFAGNIGKAQAVPTIIEAASLLLESDCQVVFVGAGSMLEWAKQEAIRLKLDNVHFLGRVDSRYMPWLYDRADTLLVSLTDQEIFSYTIPVKLLACLAAGKPIVASLNGEAARVLQRSRAGVAIPAGDAAALARAILSIREMSVQERSELGSSGLKYFQEHFDLNVQAQRLIEILDQRIGLST